MQVFCIVEHVLEVSVLSTFRYSILYTQLYMYNNPPTIGALESEVTVEVKTSQLPFLTVDRNVHTVLPFWPPWTIPDNAFTSQKWSTHFDL